MLMQRRNYDERRKLFDLSFRTLAVKPNDKTPWPVGWRHTGGTLYGIEEEAFYAPDANIGIQTGATLSGINIVGLDFDDKEMGHEFIRRHRVGTMVAESRRGLHLYLQGTAKNRIGVNGTPMDVRGDGGYLVAPFSTVSGFTYQWLAGPMPPQELPALDPEWIRDRRGEDRVSGGGPGADRPASVVDQRTEEWARRILFTEYFSVEGCGGDLALFRAACFLVQRARLDTRTALQMLIAWNETNSVPPWPLRRLEYKIQEAVRLIK